MRTIQIHKTIYREIDGRDCDQCDIPYLSTMCIRMNCTPKYHPEQKYVHFKKQTDPRNQDLFEAEP